MELKRKGWERKGVNRQGKIAYPPGLEKTETNGGECVRKGKLWGKGDH